MGLGGQNYGIGTWDLETFVGYSSSGTYLYGKCFSCGERGVFSVQISLKEMGWDGMGTGSWEGYHHVSMGGWGVGISAFTIAMRRIVRIAKDGGWSKIDSF